MNENEEIICCMMQKQIMNKDNTKRIPTNKIEKRAALKPPHINYPCFEFLSTTIAHTNEIS